ncbi:MAG: rRNA small subunit methyltransferase B [Salana multivorans]|uniref:RsmB/NOP family class I SAM-dependent RNA methyltransferase n=1 Tax=Salana multivorans TaxID=120377 RepID=UPI000AD0BC17|nr:transcription antitermination factor NusB [Salana multivorans]MBN8882810.1 rRNA small subunit methyltransferase B [Salana multivorans]
MSVDAPRRAAYDVLRAVAESDSYANLVLPPLLAERRISGRDAAFATELAYGTLRLRGYYDAVLALCATRPLSEIDPRVLDALRLGAHQLLGMRVPPHAGVASTVDLVRDVAGPGAAKFANAVLRQVGRADPAEWDRRLAERATDRLELLAARTSHPAWIVRALRESLAADGAAGELGELLTADNAAPRVTLAARPGLVSERELEREHHVSPFPGVPTAWHLDGGDPGRIPAVRQGRLGVQDAGSQLVTLAFAGAPVTGRDRVWADLCAGPGGKSALLGALLAERTGWADGEADGRFDDEAETDARPALVAGEVQPHRVGLVQRSVKAVPRGLIDVRQWDGRDLGRDEPGRFDRVLVDAPCTGLGALRRRPEARWRRTPADLDSLTGLQTALLTSAIDATRPGGVVGYVTCSPHLAETRGIVEPVLAGRDDVEPIDAVEVARAVAPGLAGIAETDGRGPFLQLWPHRHGTDAMFLALLRRR